MTEVLAHGPLEMEFVTGVIVGGLVLERRSQAKRAVELELGGWLDIGEAPAEIDRRSVEADIGIEPTSERPVGSSPWI